jgi:hypothetical protein
MREPTSSPRRVLAFLRDEARWRELLTQFQLVLTSSAELSIGATRPLTCLVTWLGPPVPTNDNNASTPVMLSISSTEHCTKSGAPRFAHLQIHYLIMGGSEKLHCSPLPL